MFVVAGVTGHVGSVVAESLVAKGQKTRVIVRDAAKGEPWARKGADIAIAKLDDRASLASALRGARGFFALLPPNYDAADFFATQKATSDAIADAVKDSGVPHVVLLSSIGADLAQGNGPVRGLHYLEGRLRETGTVLTAIRAGSFQENVGRFLDPARKLGIYPNFFPSADIATPQIATKDIGDLAATTLLSPPAKSEVIDLHGPAYSVRQVAEKLGAALGKKLQIVDVPEPGWVAAMVQGGLSQQIAELFAEMYRGFISGTIRPSGDRLVQGKTTLDEVLPTVIG